MRNRTVWWIVIAALAASTLACWGGFRLPGSPSRRTVRGSGKVVEESREIGGVRVVELATIGTLTVEAGERETLRIEAQEDLLPYIETEVRSGKLTIDTQDGINLRPTEPIRYRLTVTGLDEIAVSSSGDVEVADLEGERLSVVLQSSGDLTMGDLRCTTFDVTLSSSGDLTIEELDATTIRVRSTSSGDIDIARGEVERQDIRLSSSGDYRARDLDSAEAEVELTSSGKATIRVSDGLTALLTSSGDLVYIGGPQVDQTTRSSGKVLRQGE